MKAVVLLLVALFLLLLSPSTPAQHDYVVGLPAEMDKETADILYRQVCSLILTQAADSDRVQVWDAANLQRIVSLTVPALGSRTSANARANRLKAETAALQQFLRGAAEAHTGKALQTRLPQFLEVVGALHAPDVRVILFGSPFYTDERDPAFNFGGGSWPGDVPLLVDSRTSPFGTADKLEMLKNTPGVHVCYLEDALFAQDIERTSVCRFWGLYISRCGGVLATFTSSPELATENAVSGLKSPVRVDQIEPEAAGQVEAFRAAVAIHDRAQRLQILRATFKVAESNNPPQRTTTPAPSPTAPKAPPPASNPGSAAPAATSQGNAPNAAPTLPAPPAKTPPAPVAAPVSPQPQAKRPALAPLQPKVEAPAPTPVAPHVPPPRKAEPPPAPVPPKVPPPALEVVRKEVSKPKGTIRFGLAWTSCGCGAGGGTDLDLHVQAPGASFPLNFRNRTSAYGTHIRDGQSAGQRADWAASWECIELYGVSWEDLASYSCWVNLYRGTGDAVSGVLRCSDGARTVDLPFSFPAKLTGDSGKGNASQREGPCWVRINLAAALPR